MMNIRDPFTRAHIKLTLFYVLITALLSISATAVVYEVFTNTIRSNVEYDFLVLAYGTEAGEEFVEAVAAHILYILLAIDVTLVCIVALFGYLFAGRTLRPVRIALQTQEQFIANAAHELRTPLAVMKTGIETIPNAPLTKEEVQECKHDVLEEVEGLIDTTNDLLTLTKEDAYQSLPVAHAPHTPINISDVCQHVCARMRAYADKKHIHFSTDITPNVYVAIEKNDAVKIVRNIVKNAIDYTPDEGNVTISLKKEKKRAVCSVTDTGVGIPPADVKKVLQRFYKSESGTGMSNGSGLGLAIVDMLVRRNNGSIDIASTVGKGTAVTITLSLARA